MCSVCVYSGILLKDLVAVDGQSKDYTNKEEKTVNMMKYKKLWQQLSRLRQYQVHVYFKGSCMYYMLV